MRHHFKILFFLLVLILTSCVENRIFIHLQPNGQTYFMFNSKGDSIDIYNQDFLHPQALSQWVTSTKVIEIDNEKNWVMSTEGILKDSSILFFKKDKLPLGYSFTRSTNKSWYKTEYEFSLSLGGRKIKNEFPKLYDAIKNEKTDSLYWLPEALTVLMQKGLNDISSHSLSQKQKVRNQRFVNHLRNSFARVTTMKDLKLIQNNRVAYLTKLLKPFDVEPNFPSELASAMLYHEKILQSTLDLNDDTFILKVIMPGKPIFTNAVEIIADTLIWNFGIDSLLSDSFKLNGKSVIYTTDRFQKTLISIGLLTLVFIGILIKRKN
mgnify:FL=1|jgi:hypothetical protein